MADELDLIRRMRPDLSGPPDPIDPGVLAAERRELLADLGVQSDGPPTGRAVRLEPRLAYEDVLAALAFLTEAFGFTELRESRTGDVDDADGVFGWVQVGSTVVMVSRGGARNHGIHSPRIAGMSTATFNVVVDDIDIHYRRAVGYGAEIVQELGDTFWGYRRYEALDPEGHRWHFLEPLSDVRRRLGTVHEGE